MVVNFPSGRVRVGGAGRGWGACARRKGLDLGSASGGEERGRTGKAAKKGTGEFGRELLEWRLFEWGNGCRCPLKPKTNNFFVCCQRRFFLGFRR